MPNILKNFPSSEYLLKRYRSEDYHGILKVNGHIHSPYSFSSFTDTEEAFKMSSSEDVKVLGINDFYTTDAYEEFYNLSLKYRIFPLFNIEFMGLIKEAQEEGIRINDPSNPGRIYLSGKGLDYPVNKNSPAFNRLSEIKNESHDQIKSMVKKASDFLVMIDPALKLDFSEIRNKYSMGLVRERHIARAIRIKSFELYKTTEERINFFKKLYEGKTPVAKADDISGLENEIRSRFLKSGGRAYVKENPDSLAQLSEITELIFELGGIPCYPVLLDDSNGQLTDFEKDYNLLDQKLLSNNINCIELIPSRNDPGKLEEFVRFFDSRNYIITMGTEHNTPDIYPVSVRGKNAIFLNDYLNKVSYEGACVIAAHQYLRAKAKEGFRSANGRMLLSQKKRLTEIGASVIQYFLNENFKKIIN